MVWETISGDAIFFSPPFLRGRPGLVTTVAAAPKINYEILEGGKSQSFVEFLWLSNFKIVEFRKSKFLIKYSFRHPRLLQHSPHPPNRAYEWVRILEVYIVT
jgi:hypothetical protein